MRFDTPSSRGATTCAAALVVLFLLAGDAIATVVRFDTVLGAIDVRLYQAATPQTVANFLNYVGDQDWDDTFFHRSVPGFVVQGGGFKFDDSEGLSSVPSDPAVQNEPGISNLRGTIAMAKIGGDPDSATSQWFFNLDDNSENLDNQNGGFTVFGRVLGDGMDVADAISQLTRVNAGSPFDSLPVIDWTPGTAILDENLVNVTTVRVLDIPAGDFNRDGVVDAADYTVWRDSYGSTSLADADADGDGVVGDSDYLVWSASVSGSTSTAVPEPAGVALFTLTGALLLARPTRRG